MNYVKIKSIEKINNESLLYDIEVDKTHCFFANDILVHNSSATFYINNDFFGVCSRNLDLQETEGNTFWKVARELDLENKMREFGGNFSLQGELVGEGVQGNPYKLKGQTVRFFNVFDIDEGEYLPLEKFKFIINHLGLETVPILDEEFTLPQSVDELLEYADSKSVLNPDFDREGVVIRSTDRTISYKAISNKFLLKEK
jgi:RNA ligase (TIGR02306 family)